MSYVTNGDPAAVRLLGAKAAAGCSLERLLKPLADVFLRADDEPIQRLDRAECRAHRAWLDRIEEAAGER